MKGTNPCMASLNWPLRWLILINPHTTFLIWRFVGDFFSSKLQNLGFIAEVCYMHFIFLIYCTYVNSIVCISLLLVVPCHTALLSVQKTFKGNAIDISVFFSFFSAFINMSAALAKHSINKYTQ